MTLKELKVSQRIFLSSLLHFPMYQSNVDGVYNFTTREKIILGAEGKAQVVKHLPNKH
jgi:hypothetical protein